MCKSSGSSTDHITAGHEVKIVRVRDQNSEVAIYTLLYNKFQDSDMGTYINLLIGVTVLIALLYCKAKFCGWCPTLKCNKQTPGKQHCGGYHYNNPMQPVMPNPCLYNDMPTYPFSHLMPSMPPRSYNWAGIVTSPDERYYF